MTNPKKQPDFGETAIVLLQPTSDLSENFMPKGTNKSETHSMVVIDTFLSRNMTVTKPHIIRKAHIRETRTWQA